MDYNPKKASQILDRAGFVDKDGDGWRDNPDGTAISFKVSVPAGWTDWINTVMVITENLQDIKINARMHTPDEGAWFDTIATGDMDSYMMWNNAYTTPWQTYDELVNPSRQQPGTIQEQGIHQYKLPGVMPLMKEFTMTADDAKQHKVLGEIQELYAAHMPTIPLFAGAMFFEYNTERFEGFANQDNPFVRPLVWQGVPERLVHILNLSLKDGAPVKYKY